MWRPLARTARLPYTGPTSRPAAMVTPSRLRVAACSTLTLHPGSKRGISGTPWRYGSGAASGATRNDRCSWRTTGRIFLDVSSHRGDLHKGTYAAGVSSPSAGGHTHTGREQERACLRYILDVDLLECSSSADSRLLQVQRGRPPRSRMPTGQSMVVTSTWKPLGIFVSSSQPPLVDPGPRCHSAGARAGWVPRAPRVLWAPRGP